MRLFVVTMRLTLFVLLLLVIFYVIKLQYSDWIWVDKPSKHAAHESTTGFDYKEAAAMLKYIEHYYDPEKIDVKNLALLMRKMTQIRLSLQSWTTRGKHQDSLVSNGHDKIVQHMQKIESKVYPFLNGKYKTVEQWMASYSGRGIVMTAGPNHLRYVVFLLKNLKAVGCELPVQLVIEDAGQLSTEKQKMLTNMGVQLVFLNEVIVNGNTQFFGYSMKLASMFVSSFREAILLDCDDVFLRNPQLLFDDDGYKATGTLYFPDQPQRLNSFSKRDWLAVNLPQPLSDRVLKSNMFKGHEREVDSSAVVMDKVRCFYGLLAATRINMRKESETLYPIISWGDSELWWIAFEMIAMPYSISPFTAGAIGPVNGSTVCGKLVHAGNDGRPFYWNQGLVNAKNVASDELLKFEAYTDNGIVAITTRHLYCVKGTRPTMLNKTETDLIDYLKALWLSTTQFQNW